MLDSIYSASFLSLIYCVAITIYVVNIYKNNKNFKLTSVIFFLIGWYIIWYVAFMVGGFFRFFGSTVAVLAGSGVGTFLSINFFESLDTPIHISKKQAKYLVLICSTFAFGLGLPAIYSEGFPTDLTHLGVFHLLIIMIVWQICFTVLMVKAVQESRTQAEIVQTAQSGDAKVSGAMPLPDFISKVKEEIKNRK